MKPDNNTTVHGDVQNLETCNLEFVQEKSSQA